MFTTFSPGYLLYRASLRCSTSRINRPLGLNAVKGETYTRVTKVRVGLRLVAEANLQLPSAIVESGVTADGLQSHPSQHTDGEQQGDPEQRTLRARTDPQARA